MSARAELKAKSTLDSTGFDRGLAKMGHRAKSFATGELAAVGKAMAGVFAVSALVGTAKAMSDIADQVQNLSVSLGITTDEVQALQYIARETGLPFEGITAAINKLRDAQEEVAVSGNKQMIAAFERLGITADEVLGSTTVQLFDKVLKGAKTSATAVKSLNDIMGRGGSAIIKPLSTEAQSMQEMVDAAKEAKQIIGQAELISIDRAADRLTRGKTMAMVGASKIIPVSPGAAESMAKSKQAALLEQQRVEAEGRKEIALKREEAGKEKKEEKLEKAIDKIKIDRSPIGGRQFADQLQRMGAGLGSLSTSPFAEAQKTRMVAEKTKEIMEDSVATQKQIADNTSALKEG